MSRNYMFKQTQDLTKESICSSTVDASNNYSLRLYIRLNCLERVSFQHSEVAPRTMAAVQTQVRQDRLWAKRRDDTDIMPNAHFLLGKLDVKLNNPQLKNTSKGFLYSSC